MYVPKIERSQDILKYLYECSNVKNFHSIMILCSNDLMLTFERDIARSGILFEHLIVIFEHMSRNQGQLNMFLSQSKIFEWG